MIDEKREKGDYLSTAERTSSFSIFPPTPVARSKAPVFDILVALQLKIASQN